MSCVGAFLDPSAGGAAHPNIFWILVRLAVIPIVIVLLALSSS
jgi:hypothetical protein